MYIAKNLQNQLQTVHLTKFLQSILTADHQLKTIISACIAEIGQIYSSLVFWTCKRELNHF